jgi:putative sigma-54 modulation protein
MNIAWTGKQEFIHPTQQKSIDSKIAHLSKLLDAEGKGEKKAHGILNQHRNQHRAEVTLHFLDHHLVGEHIDPDQFTAINVALEKLEKQIVKVRDKRRDTKKGPREGWDKGAAANTIIAANPGPEGIPAAVPVSNGKPQVFQLTPGDTKPMNSEEAVAEIEANQPYFVYLNSATNRPAVILRRSDGNFDLVEC